MAEQIGMFDAKTRFSELVDRVQSTGQAITVTNRGKPVAEIAPVRGADRSGMTREEAFAQVANLWKTVEPMSKEEIRESIDEGRDRCPHV